VREPDELEVEASSQCDYASRQRRSGTAEARVVDIVRNVVGIGCFEIQVIEDIVGPKEGQRIFRLTGPIVITNLFEFQSKVRNDTSQTLMLDFTKVPYIDSAGIGALVGAYVTHQKDGRSLLLIGVSQRVKDALQVTRVQQFFKFVESPSQVTS